MGSKDKRKEKDKYVLENFIRIFCRGLHNDAKKELCEDCRGLLEYSINRLEKCPYDPKPACKNCETHCYKPEYREKIRAVMKYSGKRLILKGRLDLMLKYFF